MSSIHLPLKENIFPDILYGMEEQSPDLILEVQAPNAKRESFLFYSQVISILIIIIVVFLVGGFTIGRFLKNSNIISGKVPAQATTSASQKAGFLTFVDKSAGYSLEIPSDWKAFPKEGEMGVNVTNERSTLEITLSVDKPYELGKEQKDAIRETKKINLNIDGGRVVEAEDNQYFAGGGFLVAVLPSNDNKPQVTFWLTATSDDDKKVGISTVESFQFTKK